MTYDYYYYYYFPQMFYKLGSFEAYCVAMAAAFIQYLKFKIVVQKPKNVYTKNLLRGNKLDLLKFTDEEKEAIQMWACSATYFKPRHTSGCAVYCSTYGCLGMYTSKEVCWKNDVEHVPSNYQPTILLVDTEVDCNESCRVPPCSMINLISSVLKKNQICGLKLPW